MKTQQVLEYSEPGVRGNVIRGVKIIGTRSKHGRDYPLAVLREAIPLYEDAPVFMAHPDGREKRQGSRQLGDHFGSLEKVSENGAGLYADLRVKRTHPQAKSILESALTAKFGLSHNAVVTMTDDGKIVTEIVAVNSVDLVNSPATTRTLFEGNTMPEPTVTPPATPPGKPGTADAKDSFEDKVLGSLEKLDARLDALEKKPVLEEAKPARRLTALETKTVEEGEPAPIGKTYEDFLAALRGFPVTN